MSRPSLILLGADVEAAAAHQRVAGDQDEVEQHLQRRLAHRRLVDHPAELDAAVAAEQALDRAARLARVDDVGEAARGAERQAEEFELVGRGPRAFGEQIEAAGAHLRIMLVGEQFDAVVERADRRKQIVAQARAEQAGEFVGFHARRALLVVAGARPIGVRDSADARRRVWPGRLAP